jgi:amino acid transporter
MEQFHGRLVVGAALMGIGFLTVLLVMAELVTGGHLPAWSWGLFLLIGVGAAVVVSAFVGAGRDRRRATEELTGPAQRAPRRR